jgi:all-trans-8'-apo-beta-carotenal 15,15'-oxygenase
MITRRESIALLGAAGSALALGGDLATARASPGAAAPLSPDRKWLAQLGQELPEEYDYVAQVEGRLPEALTGTLYRNGPGLFDRAGFRKWTILDGDGMIRAFRLAGGQARFQNRFVRTNKFAAEQRAHEFLYPTWTTPAPGLFANIPAIPRRSQAGVTPVVKGGVLYAFDEVGLPYAMDPASLETRQEIDPCEGARDRGPVHYKAHTKTDGGSGDWVLIGQTGVRNPLLHVVVKDRLGRQTRHVTHRSPRPSAYFHDFFWADPYVVLHLHPALLSSFPLPMLAGLRTYVDSLEWRPEQGSLLFFIDTTGSRPPFTIDAPPTWMWHSLNAYTVGDQMRADFIGYEAPDHFLGPNATFRQIMQGREGVANAPGTLRRLTVDLSQKRARLETLAEGHYEFPIIPPNRVGQRHRYGYVASNGLGQGWFHDGIARIDTESGAQRAFHFGPGYYVGEPVFAPAPAHAGESESLQDHGWLLAEVLEGASLKSFLAVFDAEHLEDGPIAKIRLRHHLPFSFHGWWEAA